MRDRERMRKAGLQRSNAEIVQQDMQNSGNANVARKLDYGDGGYKPTK
jgi:hypothetical protein